MAEPQPWPPPLLPPREALAWLDQQRPANPVGRKAVLTLRWLVHAELERAGPDLPATPKINPPEDLTSDPL